eukprot:CAMPEP_0172777816 /NCGR_PEP_ID=MMETSP1074-20121228/201594_1 /TAXON_ID=2916 /ORGANISM="Ceratium fusus, Strain PA161109" /LENGTH=505 /DNA_ID=CAMNT_0013614745 /DNA_START=113 /DNA_END=1629 /DNA_ORIENTATION=-
MTGDSDIQSLSTNASWDEQCAEVQLFQSWQPTLTQPGKELSTLRDGDLQGMLQEEIQKPGASVHEKMDQNASMEPSVLHELLQTSHTANKVVSTSPVQTNTMSAASHRTHAVVSTAWGQGLLDLQQKLDGQIKKQHLAQAEQHLAHQHQAWDKAFQQIKQQHLAQAGKHLAHQHQAWDKAFSAEIASYERELCEDPSRRDYAVCIRLRKHDEETMENDALEENYNQRRAESATWSTGLQDLQKRLEERRQALHQRHHAHSRLSSNHVKGMTDWAADLERRDYAVCIRLRKHDKETTENDAFEESYKQHRAESATWATGLQDLQKRLEERRQALHQRHHAHSRLTSNHVKGMTDWAADLEAMQMQLKDRSPSSSKPVEAASAALHATTWSVELEALQQRIEARQGKQQQLGKTNILPGELEDDGHHLLNRIVGLNKQLCDDPTRRGLPSCAQFRSESAVATSSSKVDALEPGTAGKRLRGGRIVAKELQEHEKRVHHLQDSHRQWE